MKIFIFIDFSIHENINSGPLLKTLLFTFVDVHMQYFSELITNILSFLQL